MADHSSKRKAWLWLVLAATVILCAGVADWLMSRSMTCSEFEAILESDARTSEQIYEAVVAENGHGWSFDYQISHEQRVDNIKKRPDDIHWLHGNNRLPSKPRLQTYGAYNHAWSASADAGHNIYTVVFDENDNAIGYLRVEF